MSGETVRITDIKSDMEGKSRGNLDLQHIDMGLFADVRVALEARLGEAPMTVESIMALKAGSIVTLETGLADHVELYLNDTLVARGEIVAVDGKYGVRIIEIATKP
jgi:flagellar motor switch protein FliN/FliY